MQALSIMDLSIPNYLKTRNAYRGIYEQYVDEASFLWVLRDVATKQPHYDASDILELEQRIEAQLDGLMTSVDIGWDVCDAVLDIQEPGEVFTSTVIAMRSHETHKIQRAVDVGLQTESTFRGLASAIAWLPSEISNPWIEKFLYGKDMNHKYLGLAACSLRRQDPGELLNNIFHRDDCLQHEKLHARALRLVGELRRQDCMPAILTAMKSGNEDLQFWASWSAILLGQKSAIEHLKPFLLKQGKYLDKTIQLVFRVLPVELSRELISELAVDEIHLRTVIKATGVLGDPHAVNWLIGKMQNVMSAKLAGESFSLITGIDLEKHHLAIELPENYPVIPNDDVDDENIDLDEDENLPYPDIEKVAAIWRRLGQQFIVGRRYIMGRPITAELLKDKIAHGFQRQRHAAALELALLGEMPLPNTHARIMAS